MSDDLTQPDYRSTETGPTTGGLVPDKDEEIRRLTALVEDLRRVYTDPPPDVQEAVIKKLNLVSGEGHELLRQRAEQAERARALAQAACSEALGYVRGLCDYYIGEHACGDFTCACGSPNCGLCEARKETEKFLARPNPGAPLLARLAAQTKALTAIRDDGMDAKQCQIMAAQALAECGSTIHYTGGSSTCHKVWGHNDPHDYQKNAALEVPMSDDLTQPDLARVERLEAVKNAAQEAQLWGNFEDTGPAMEAKAKLDKALYDLAALEVPHE